ncbi:Signal transduction histidine kinase [Virgibacillus subterraneus]|uniref:Signal transduction histidine kinase n=1 Tax=Virgibacillus subterraneus TaxID=621109 RepID=A0A1H8ZC74_9BACI|nr:sensor histidine kinase [Virgibacillus subterraneus]SEP61964.1 Signal transduction histidine kinase [Virgibacillus subterraneus]
MAQFRPMARIISHLGERLISSTKVALLELVKNSYDAKSEFVEITINQKEKQIVIYDEGHGMDNKTIENFWLVVGTNNRLENKGVVNNNEDIPLGEKGLGRFSTMKLGNKLLLQTTTKESNVVWNLEVDWDKFGYKSDLYLDEIDNSLYDTPKTENRSFTKIVITDIKDFIGEEWSKLEVEKFISNTVAKYINPFNDLPRKFKIKVWFIDQYNKKSFIKLGQSEKELLEQAHHEIKGEYIPGQINYLFKVKRNGIIVDQGEDNILLDSKLHDLDSLAEGFVGKFKFHFYIFNRRRLKELTGFENTRVIREILDRYTGGPMIFRDGFRIFPYGDPGDDWLELNKEKYRKGKASIIGEQTTGYIALNSNKSPYLVDQTNREGLVRNRSFDNFSYIVKSIFNKLLDIVEINEPKETSNNITNTAKKSATNIEKTILRISSSREIVDKDLKNIIKESKLINKGISELKRREKALIETSSVGMTSMQIAHEIHNFVQKILSILHDLKTQLPNEYLNKIDILELNIKSLKAMISQIDEQASTLRRAKSKLDLVKQIKQIVNTSKSLLNNYKNIPLEVEVISEVESLDIKVNKGLLIQLFDNLLINSFYWVNSLGTLDNTNKGIIRIEIKKDGHVIFYDNGTGISLIDSESIFEPFFSRRKDGKGLGLFICREIAAYHKIKLDLLENKNSKGRLYCFSLDFSEVIIGGE